MAAFTDRGLRALAVRDIPYRVTEGGSDPGFGVRVMPSGVKTFFLRYSLHGTRRYHNLGEWPAVTLAEARREARRVRTRITRGEDPRLHTGERRIGSVAELVERYLADLERRGGRTVHTTRNLFARDLLPAIGSMPAAEVQPAHIQEVLHRPLNRGARVQAEKLRDQINTVFRFGLSYDLTPAAAGDTVRFNLDRNPVDKIPIDRGARRGTRDRVLSWAEIRTLWHSRRIAAPYRLQLQLLLATGGPRSMEIVGLPIKEINFNERRLEIPPSRVKQKPEQTRWNIIPLTDLALELIDTAYALVGRQGPFLFPARGLGSADKPQGAGTLPNAVSALCAEGEMEKFTPHDLRRTFKTLGGELGISKEHRDRVQGHMDSDISSRHYDRYDYLPEKREALERWCKTLHQTVKTE